MVRDVGDAQQCSLDPMEALVLAGSTLPRSKAEAILVYLVQRFESWPAVGNGIWTAETTPARDQRSRDLYMAALPPEYRQEPGHRAKWLWRTLRAAELAGLDPADALKAAIGERDLVGARDIPSVIDARLRRHIGPLVPLPVGPWSAQRIEIADPERRAFAAELAALLDERKERIGVHAATSAVPWAVAALGPVPEKDQERGQCLNPPNKGRARPAGPPITGSSARGGVR
jgi:hypothetical protein